MDQCIGGAFIWSSYIALSRVLLVLGRNLMKMGSDNRQELLILFIVIGGAQGSML